MKKVLLITYYWPPAGGPGVQRILKFAKYLPQFGWQPIILTVANGEYPAIDESLSTDIPKEGLVFKTKSLEPNQMYKNFIGLKKDSSVPISVLAEENKSLKQSVAHWIRLNLFIPDAKIGWLPYAFSEGKKIISDYQPDIIFSSSPPPTVHMIAKKLKAYSQLKWVADFRDPWTDIHYYEKQNRLALTKWIDKKLENKVLKVADRVVCISKLDIEQDFSKKTSAEKCINIPNGYDDQDFNNPIRMQKKEKRFVLLHLGAVGIERNPLQLFKAIYTLHKENIITPDTFTLRFIGNIENEVLNTIKKEMIIDFVEVIDYLPHAQAIEATVQASAMLLLVTQSKKNIRILPGKTFEYLRTGKPVLALGPQGGEVDRILSEVNGGRLIEYKAYEQIQSYLVSLIDAWKHDTMKSVQSELIKKYERKNLTANLVQVFEELL